MLDSHLFLRILVAALLGGVIGLERDRRGRPAGLRTHMIVALAAASYMVVSTQFIEHQRYSAGEHVEVDVSRIAASIVTGIGFLGGGAIMRSGLNVVGLTTAAGLWLVGAIGMASGGGMYLTAVFVTLLGLLALTSLRRFEDKDDNQHLRRVRVVLSASSLEDVVSRLARVGSRTGVLACERDARSGQLTGLLEVWTARDVTQERRLAEVSSAPGIEHVRVESGNA